MSVVTCDVLINSTTVVVGAVAPVERAVSFAASLGMPVIGSYIWSSALLPPPKVGQRVFAMSCL